MVKDGIVLSGRYDVISKLGAGGMADVYKGRDRMLNRYVAIKVLKKEYREDEEFLQKFRSEAQAAAGLLNPNIVNVYDVGSDRGLYYMVMELVEGITLKEYIQKKGRLSTREVISIAIQMCTGIEAAHAHNIIHRDIKPQNIIISKEGKVKVTDFGIAKAADSHTVSSNAMGSVHYVSPEQARGGFCDAKSDIYSAGITMYEMVTGRVPFDGDSTVSVAMKHLQEMITPPSRYAPDISQALEKIILKCTQKSADRRYADVSLLIQDLKRALVNPDGEFVSGVAPRSAGDTVMISSGDVDRLRGRQEDEYDEDEYDEDGYDEYDEDEYDEDEEYDDGDRRRDEAKKNRAREQQKKMNKTITIIGVIVAVILVFALVFLIGKTGIFGGNKPTEITDTKEIEVPNLIGQEKVVAERMCEKKNLELVVVGEKPSSKYKAGVVMEQTPEEGENAAKKTQIKVVLSTGPKEVSVPSVTGQDEDAAKKALTSAGIKDADIKVEYQNDSSVESGKAIGTNPSAGTKVKSGEKITLYVSQGAEQVSVPNLQGKNAAEAAGILQKAKLNDGGASGEEYSARYPQGQIISQSIPNGQRVDAGTSITYVVSLGPEPAAQVAVPSVLGYSLSDATGRLQSAGLNVGNRTYQDSSEPYNTVIGVDPGEGTNVDEGTRVNLILSNGPKTNETDESVDSSVSFVFGPLLKIRFTLVPSST